MIRDTKRLSRDIFRRARVYRGSLCSGIEEDRKSTYEKHWVVAHGVNLKKVAEVTFAQRLIYRIIEILQPNKPAAAKCSALSSVRWIWSLRGPGYPGEPGSLGATTGDRSAWSAERQRRNGGAGRISVKEGPVNERKCHPVEVRNGARRVRSWNVPLYASPPPCGMRACVRAYGRGAKCFWNRKTHAALSPVHWPSYDVTGRDALRRSPLTVATRRMPTTTTTTTAVPRPFYARVTRACRVGTSACTCGRHTWRLLLSLSSSCSLTLFLYHILVTCVFNPGAVGAESPENPAARKWISRRDGSFYRPQNYTYISLGILWVVICVRKKKNGSWLGLLIVRVY